MDRLSRNDTTNRRPRCTVDFLLSPDCSVSRTKKSLLNARSVRAVRSAAMGQIPERKLHPQRGVRHPRSSVASDLRSTVYFNRVFHMKCHLSGCKTLTSHLLPCTYTYQHNGRERQPRGETEGSKAGYAVYDLLHARTDRVAEQFGSRTARLQGNARPTGGRSFVSQIARGRDAGSLRDHGSELGWHVTTQPGLEPREINSSSEKVSK